MSACDWLLVGSAICVVVAGIVGAIQTIRQWRSDQ